MNKFETYKELIEEKQRLEMLLPDIKEIIREDIRKLKLQLKPMNEIAGHVKKFTVRDKTNLMVSLSSDLIANTFLKKIILARAGWFTKLVLPYLIRNYSSNFLKEQKDKFFNRISEIIKHKNGKSAESY